MNHYWFRFQLFLVGWVLWFPDPSRAHGPYDHSAQLIVGQEQLTLVITMGADATRDFLARTELPPEQQQALIMSSSPTPKPLPPGVAARMFEINADGQALAPQQVLIAFQGLETLFTLIYPRPAARSLDCRATYFNGIEPMKRGPLLAYDEEFNSLGAANLSRVENRTQILLPAINPPALAKTDAEPAATVPATNNFSRSAPAVSAQKAGGVVWVLIAALALPLLASVLWWKRRDFSK